MPRIAGTTIPDNKNIVISLTYIFGIGPALSLKIIEKAKVDPKVRASALKAEELNRIKDIIEKEYRVEGELKRDILANVKRLERHAPHEETSGARPAYQDEYEDRERERTKNHGLGQKTRSFTHIILTYGKETSRTKRRRGRNPQGNSKGSQALKSRGAGPRLHFLFLQQHHYVVDR